MKSETMTLLSVNLASMMERADEKLLPAMYDEIGEDLQIDLIGLGLLTLFRSIVQSLCYPLAAYLASNHNRVHVIALGAFLWAAASFLFAICSNSFFELAVARGLNGIGLAIVLPAIQSLVADSTDASNRGLAFGLLQLTANLGSIVGGPCSVLIAKKSVMGVAGWRIAFHMVAFMSVIVGLLVCLFAKDPRFSKSDSGARNQALHKPFWSNVKELIQEAKSVIRIPSFQIIVAQGVSGSIPGSAFVFLTLWLELIGFSHEKAAILLTILIIGNSFGCVFGGWMGDNLAKCLPNSGRIILSQISSASLVPTAAFLLLVLPDDPSTAFMHGLALFIMAFFASWDAAATNNPIFAEIVPEKSRTSIYALDRSFETILSSFAPAVVGILAQNLYGDKRIPKGVSTPAEIETNKRKAASLAKALYTAIGIPAAICCFIYSFLYCTYPRDREHARMYALIESEMQKIEVDNSLSDKIDIDYEGLDDNNEKSSLLQH